MRARITICGLIIFPFHRLEHKFEILRVATFDSWVNDAEPINYQHDYAFLKTSLPVSGVQPLALASTDPAAYVRALAAAGAAAELTDPAGLGGHFWVVEPIGIGSPL